MMLDVVENIDFDDSLDLSSTDRLTDQSESTIRNGSADTFDGELHLTNETMRFLFLTVATITLLLCLTICLAVLICICLNRRQKIKRREMKEHRLLPEQSEKISTPKIPFSNPIRKASLSNVKQQYERKTTSILQHSSSNTITNKPTIKSSYYDNLDDIPFIDESRPTSFIDITRV